MKRFIAAALLTFIAWTSYAGASQKSVEEMMSLMKVREKYIKSMTAMINKKIEAKGKDDPLMKKVLEEFKSGTLSWESVKPEFIKIYSETFSENEVTALCDFCKSKIGSQAMEDPEGFKKKIKQPGFLSSLSPADIQEMQKFTSSETLKKAIAKKAIVKQKTKQLGADRATKIVQEFKQSPSK